MVPGWREGVMGMDQETLALVLQGMAAKVLEVMPAELTCEVRGEVRHGQVRVVVIAAPILPLSRPALVAQPGNGCERDLLAALRELGASPERRFRRPEILARLEERHTPHGRSTISNALARMSRPHVGLLLNGHDHTGYGLPLSPEDFEPTA